MYAIDYIRMHGCYAFLAPVITHACGDDVLTSCTKKANIQLVLSVDITSLILCENTTDTELIKYAGHKYMNAEHLHFAYASHSWWKLINLIINATRKTTFRVCLHCFGATYAGFES